MILHAASFENFRCNFMLKSNGEYRFSIVKINKVREFTFYCINLRVFINY